MNKLTNALSTIANKTKEINMFKRFRRQTNDNLVATYSIKCFQGATTGFADDQSMAMGEGFCNMLCLMAGVPAQLPIKYIDYNTNGEGNMIKALMPDGSIIEVQLGGCDVSEFLTCVQLTCAGVEPVWTFMQRPSYWPNIETYNFYSEAINVAIQQSLAVLDNKGPAVNFNYKEVM